MILHDITNDAKLVKVAPAAFSAKVLLHGDLHVADVVAIPKWIQEGVGKPHRQHVLQRGQRRYSEYIDTKATR